MRSPNIWASKKVFPSQYSSYRFLVFFWMTWLVKFVLTNKSAHHNHSNIDKSVWNVHQFMLPKELDHVKATTKCTKPFPTESNAIISKHFNKHFRRPWDFGFIYSVLFHLANISYLIPNRNSRKQVTKLSKSFSTILDFIDKK